MHSYTLIYRMDGYDASFIGFGKTWHDAVMDAYDECKRFLGVHNDQFIASRVVHEDSLVAA